jgi:hypothetical protein
MGLAKGVLCTSTRLADDEDAHGESESNNEEGRLGVFPVTSYTVSRSLLNLRIPVTNSPPRQFSRSKTRFLDIAACECPSTPQHTGDKGSWSDLTKGSEQPTSGRGLGVNQHLISAQLPPLSVSLRVRPTTGQIGDPIAGRRVAQVNDGRQGDASYNLPL